MPLDVSGIVRLSYEQATGPSQSFVVSGLYGSEKTLAGRVQLAGVGVEWRWYLEDIKPGFGPWGLPYWWGQDVPGKALEGLWYGPQLRLLQLRVDGESTLVGGVGGRAGYQWLLRNGLSLQVAVGVHYLFGRFGTISPDFWELGAGVGYAW